MGRTRTQLRTLTAQQLTSFPLVTGTSTASSATTLTDATVLSRFNDDELVGMHLYLNDATVKERIITDSVQSTGVITFRPSSSAGMDGTDAYEVLPFAADAIHSAINEVLLELYDLGVLVRKHWLRFVTGSPIYNADMNYWTSSSALHGWTASGTVAQLTGDANRWISDNAARISVGNLTLDATWARFLADMAPGSMRLHAWLRCDTASGGRLAILENGSALATSSYHEGDSDWHLVSTATTTLTDGETDISVQVQRAAGNVDVGLVWIEPTLTLGYHPLPIALMPEGPDALTIQGVGTDTANLRATVVGTRERSLEGYEWMRYHDSALNAEYGMLRWLKLPPAGYLVRASGSGPLSQLSADTGILEVNQFESLLVAKAAALRLLERSLSTLPTASRARYAESASRLQRDIRELARGHGSRDDAVGYMPSW